MLTLAVLASQIPPIHEPIITTGGQIVIALIVATGGLLSTQLELARRQGKRTNEAVAEVAETGTTSETPFAATVTAALGRIEGEQALLRREVIALREDDRRVWDYVTNHLPREGRS